VRPEGQFNPRMGYIEASATLAVAAEVRRLRAAGETVYGLTAGEPDFDTPEPVKEAAIDALRRGVTKYSPTAGYPELRAAICRKLKEENGLDYEPDQIVVSNGAKHSLFNALCVLIRDGDEVLVPSPYWVSYVPMVQMAGGRVRFVPLGEETGFKLGAEQLEKAINRKTRLLILNSPANPTGAVYSREELAALAEVAVKHDLMVVSDEVYEKILFDGLQHVSIASLGEEIKRRTVVVNGFSKTYAMTGWRLGYLAAEPPIAEAVANLQSQSTSGPNSFAQHGALAALKLPPETVEGMRRIYEVRRDTLLETLRGSPTLSVVPPQGTFYAWVDVSRTGLSGEEFARRLLAEERTAVVPGGPFGGPRYVRISFACADEVLAEGARRLVRFAESG